MSTEHVSVATSAEKLSAAMSTQHTSTATSGTDPVLRPVGLETEFGILQPGNAYANPVALATELVNAYAQATRAVRWDYESEDPLLDLRGSRLDRAAAHPSMLTDDPEHLAPSGDVASGDAGRSGHAPSSSSASGSGTTTRAGNTARSSDAPISSDAGVLPPWGHRPRPSVAEAALPRSSTCVLSNGGRFYVDHAHPEYSCPETLSPRDALIWDRTGEILAQRSVAAVAAAGGPQIALYKNNVDGKGASYGSHENFLLRRDVPFEALSASLIPFLITRPIFAGAGRVGLGQRSEQPGFQISQRADYVENDIGLQTTFNRPIINTRDEPHADATWRRFHVINGDANRFDTPIYLKVATTSLVLWLLERQVQSGEDPLAPFADVLIEGDPVEQHWAFSHDLSFGAHFRTRSGTRSALDIQEAFVQLVVDALETDGLDTQAAPESWHAIELWRGVLDKLRRWEAAMQEGADPAERGQALADVALDVEWLAKWQLCEGLRARGNLSWDDPRLAALDIQWADLTPGAGIAEKLRKAGRMRSLVADADIEAALLVPPSGTRAWLRGRAIQEIPQVVAASWTSLIVDLPGHESLYRVTLSPQVALEPTQAEADLNTLRAMTARAYGEGAPA